MDSNHKIPRLSDIKSALDSARQVLQELHRSGDAGVVSLGGKIETCLKIVEKGFEQHQGLFESAIQGYFITTIDGRGVECNQAFADMLGYEDPEELIGITDFGATHYLYPDDRARNIKILKETGSLINNEVRLKRKDGTPIYALANIKMSDDGLFEGISIDITARKLAEEKLRQSEQKYRQIIETAGEGFVLVDNDWRIRDANHTFGQMIGHDGTGLAGQPLFRYTDETFERLVKTRWVQPSEPAVKTLETALIGKASRRVPVLFHISTLQDIEGEVIGKVSFVTDITPQKRSLALAGEVQKSLLPESPPEIAGLDIAGKNLTCEEIGGDYFDYFWDLECRLNHFDAVVGDVTGHGVDAALLMTTARAFLRMRASQCGDISQIVNEMNRHLTMDVLDSGRFMTLFYMSLDVENKNLAWIRAGHDPAIVYDPGTGRFEALRGDGLPLGVDSDVVYEENFRTGLRPGQIIAIGTDGIWESFNTRGEMFGHRRFRDIIRRNAHQNSNRIIDAVFGEIDAFSKGLKREDDITLVIVKIEE